MLIVMDRSATPADVERVVETAEGMGLKAHAIAGEQRTAVGLTGNRGTIEPAAFENLPGVLEVIVVSHPYKLVSREFHPEDTVVSIGGVPVGGTRLAVIAGPCAVETLEQTVTIAKEVKARGAHLLRGGAYKPRTSPYSFQGLGEEGLKILAAAREETGLPVVTEALDTSSIDVVAKYADCLQIGARNMQNFELLKAAGRIGKPVLLKRGMSATLEEFLDRQRPGLASTYLTRLKVGPRLVDAAAVPYLYAGRVRPWHLFLVMLAGLVALAAAIAVTPVGQEWADQLSAWLSDTVRGLLP